jgi:hypothetical protein
VWLIASISHGPTCGSALISTATVALSSADRTAAVTGIATTDIAGVACAAGATHTSAVIATNVMPQISVMEEYGCYELHGALRGPLEDRHVYQAPCHALAEPTA